MTVWFDNYVDTLEEFVDENGNIFLSEYGNKFPEIKIKKNELYCLVHDKLWDKFSEVFSLYDNETESFITRWVEDTYQLKGIDTDCGNAEIDYWD